MKTIVKKIIILLLFLLLFLPTAAFAHGGSLDENGGHYDRSTGEYHYHHGYPAHEHREGNCPYEENSSIENKSSIVYATPFEYIVRALFCLTGFILIWYAIGYSKTIKNILARIEKMKSYRKNIYLFYLINSMIFILGTIAILMSLVLIFLCSVNIIAIVHPKEMYNEILTIIIMSIITSILLKISNNR